MDQQQGTKFAWQTVPPVSKPIHINLPHDTQYQKPTPNQSSIFERERRGWQQVQIPKPAPIPPAIGKTSVITGNQQQHGTVSKKNSQLNKVGDSKNKQTSKQQIVISFIIEKY